MLRQSIADRCAELGFRCRFLYQSVIVMTPLSDWCFDYHERKITLYHESTVKINFATGDYAKAHMQFHARKMTPLVVLSYIAVMMHGVQTIPAEAGIDPKPDLRSFCPNPLRRRRKSGMIEIPIF